MLREILVFVLGLIPTSIWLVVVLPFAYRALGVSLPFHPRKRNNANLSDDGKIFLQGISFSVSLAIFDLSSSYIRWKLYQHLQPNLKTVVHAMGIATVTFILVVISEATSKGLRCKEHLNKQPPE